MNTKNSSKENEKAFLFGVDTKAAVWPVKESLMELGRLSETAGYTVCGKDYQILKSPHPSTYMGSGKLEEIKNTLSGEEIDILIIDDELTPAQQRNIEKSLGNNIKLIDRTAIILNIFARHAKTREGKLQVELAQYQYMLPRLKGLWTHLIRQSGAHSGGIKGGTGLRGPGEKQIETDRRIILKKIASLTGQIEKIRRHRYLYRQKRKRHRIPVIAIVGYTNSGKSSLLNALSNAGVPVADKLFATLDPTTRKIRLPCGKEVLITDTVGFINKLPHELVASFRATLEEINEADIILHLVDISMPYADIRIKAVSKILNEIGIEYKPVIQVWNKIDKLGAPLNSYDTFNADSQVYISVKQNYGLDSLSRKIESVLKESYTFVQLFLPYSKNNLAAFLIKEGFIEKMEEHDGGYMLDVYVPPTLVENVNAYSLNRLS